MQLGLPFGAPPRAPTRTPLRDTILVGRRSLVVTYVRHRRARHYILRVDDDGTLRVTIPRGGSRKEADRFIHERAAWVERERYRVALRRTAARWEDEHRVMLRGEDTPLEVVEVPDGRAVRLGALLAPLEPGAVSVLPAVERCLRRHAAVELPDRLRQLADAVGRTVSRITVRGQRTRWGSCSPGGSISLNWRLVQMPDSVRDYVILHELTHLVHLDHSKRFWREVERVCPWHREARAWLKRNVERVSAAGRGVR